MTSPPSRPGTPTERPHLDGASIPTVEPADAPTDLDDLTGDSGDPEFVLWTALQNAPAEGSSVKDLMAATGKGRTWVYARLQNPRRRRPRHPDQPRALDRRRSRVAQVSRSSARTSAARARPYAQARATDGRPRGRPSGPPQERPPTRRTRRRSAPQVAIDEESITVTVPVQLPDLNGNAAKLLLAILVELASVDLLDRDSEEPVDDCQR